MKTHTFSIVVGTNEMEVKIKDPNYWIVERLREKDRPIPLGFKAVLKKGSVEHPIEAKDSICIRYVEPVLGAVVPTKIPCSKINVSNWGINSPYYEELKELIRKDGLKRPILVDRLRNGRFKLFDGLLRLQAVMELGFDTIDAHIM